MPCSWRPVSTVSLGSATITASLGGKTGSWAYANLGVPKNLVNPFYINTNGASNPSGFNQFGANFVDYGLGANPNPAPDGTRFMDVKPGDVPQFDGMFKAPSMRNTDQRPSPDFVRSYMHNGVFKSLEEAPY